MAKVVVSESVFVSYGAIEDRADPRAQSAAGRAFKYERGPDGDKSKVDEATAADAPLLGCVTDEGFAEARPSRTGESPTSSTG